MVDFLDKKTCDKIKAIRNTDDYKAANKEGWGSEGADDNCITIFNWLSEDDKGYLLVNYLTDKIVKNRLIDTTLEELMPFVRKTCEIARLAYGTKQDKEIGR